MEEILKQKEKVDKLGDEYLKSLLDEEADGFEHADRLEKLHNAQSAYIALLQIELGIND